MNLTEQKAELFKAYGDDATGALDAMANTFPDLWRWFLDHAAVATYRRELRTWRARQVMPRLVGQDDPTLFPAPTTKRVKRTRKVLTAPSGAVHLMDLEGVEGARILREIAERDAKPAKTTLARCHDYTRFAEQLEAAAAKGEHLTVADLIERAA